jgi:hypothetical protein
MFNFLIHDASAKSRGIGKKLVYGGDDTVSSDSPDVRIVVVCLSCLACLASCSHPEESVILTLPALLPFSFLPLLSILVCTHCTDMMSTCTLRHAQPPSPSQFTINATLTHQ